MTRHKRARRRRESFLALSALIASSLVAVPAVPASASTATSGNCVVTYTSGGNGSASVRVAESDGYCYASFHNRGLPDTATTYTWTVPANVTSASVLVVGGGGGGGSRHAGGGGAGEYVEVSTFPLTPNSQVSIQTGGGGSGAAGKYSGVTDYQGTSGVNSYFKLNSVGLHAKGGGYGSYNASAGSGGSGGGSGFGQTPGSASLTTQKDFTNTTIANASWGNSGTSGADESDSTLDYWAGGGGGGAGESGKRPTDNGSQTTRLNSASVAVAGAGGVGRTPSWLPYTLSSALQAGEVYNSKLYFAGGGGGGMGADGTSGGTGGYGGGGDGFKFSLPSPVSNDGRVSTGGGGGSSGFDDKDKPTLTDSTLGRTYVDPPGGDGGSGIVIVRYVAPTIPGAPTVTNASPSSNQLAVSVTAPASDGNSPITSYQYSTDNGTTWTSTGSTATSFTITSLENFLTYPLKVRAVNAVGSGPASGVFFGTPLPSTPSLDLNARSSRSAANIWIDQVSGNNITKASSGFPAWNAAEGLFTFSSNDLLYKSASYTNPQNYSIEAFFKTTATGAKVIGFQDSATNPSSYDRHLYLDIQGRLNFGIWSTSAHLVTSSDPVNDGTWQHAIATFDGTTQRLYLNGVLQGELDLQLVTPQSYDGSWVVGGGKLDSWSGISGSPNLAADLQIARVYQSALTESQVTSAFKAARYEPELASATRIDGGITSQLTNYNSRNSYSVSVSPEGTGSIDFSGLLTVTGVSPNTDATATVTQTLSGYASGSSDVSGKSLAKYTITYNYNGADGSATPGSEVVLEGNSATLPTPTKTGLLFGGWYANAEFSGSRLEPGATYTPNANVSLYAHWTNVVIDLDGMNDASLNNVTGSWTSVFPAKSLDTGTATGATYFSDPNSSLEGYAFRNEGDVIQFAPGVGAVSGAMTVEIWVKPYELQSDFNILATRWFTDGTADGQDWHFAIRKDTTDNQYRLNLYTSADGSNYAVDNEFGSATFVANADKWYQVGFSIDANENLQFFVNGQPDGDPIANAARTADPDSYLWIGDGRVPGYKLSADISQFRIYNTALTSDQRFERFASLAVTFGMKAIEIKAGTFGAGDDIQVSQYASESYTLPNYAAANGFTRSGYKVVGWSLDPAGSTLDYALGSTYSDSGNLTLYPYWQQDVSIATPNTGLSATVGQAFSLTPQASNGDGNYSFSYSGTLPSGLTFDSSTGMISGTPTGVESQSLTITVTDGIGTTATTSSFNIVVSAATLQDALAPTVTATSQTAKSIDVSWTAVANASGYLLKVYSSLGTLLESFTLSSSTLNYVVNQSNFSSIADGTEYRVTITATGGTNYLTSAESSQVSVSTLAFYEISYNANGADGGTIPSAQNELAGVPFSVSTNAGSLSKLGYSFSGWNTLADGNGTTYAAGDQLAITADTELFAKWTANPCTVSSSTYDGDGTIGTIGKRYTTYSFTSIGDCVWVVPVGVTEIDALVVAGGGGGGGSYDTGGAGGGGAGQVSSQTAIDVSAGDEVVIDVGAGGAGGGRETQGSSGENSTLIIDQTTITSVGGDGGARSRGDYLGRALGSGGAAATGATPARGGAHGGNQGSATGGAAGGGGGSFGNGGPAGFNSPGVGGAGTASTISGASVTYGSGGTGGDGGVARNGTSAAANTGNGGGGSAARSSSSFSGGNGGSGVVILRSEETLSIFNVTFDSKGGSAVAGSTFIDGSTVSEPTQPNRTGYVFGGWSDTDGGSAVTFPYSPGVSQAITLYAIWTAEVYTVTYSLNGADGGDLKTSDSYTFGDPALTLPVPTRLGYDFGGWFANPALSGSAVGTTYTPSADITLYAAWTGQTFTVLFNYNSADTGDSLSGDSYTSGLAGISLPTPGRTGYTFLGWFENENLTGTAVSAPYVTTQNRTLHAKWQAVPYSVTYKSTLQVGQGQIPASGGTVPIDSNTYTIGQTVPIMANTGNLNRLGYSFAGWVTNADGTGTALQSGQSLTMGAANVDLYPKWVANTYQVNYNLAGGTGDITGAPSSWTAGNNGLNLPNLTSHPTLAKTGYTFAGWSETQGGQDVGSGYITYEDVTLYAIWDIKSISYSFDKGNANSQNIANWPANSSANFASTITLPDLSGVSYTTSEATPRTFLFFGWEDDGGAIYKGGDQFVLSETSPTFTAQWVQLFDVRYAFSGGTHSVSGNGDDLCLGKALALCEDGDSIELRSAPNRSGYTFDGWRVEPASGAEVVKGPGVTHTVDANGYLFYAKWTPITYTFRFNSQNGSVNHPNQGAQIGQLVTMPDPGFRAGYSFAGWANNVDSTILPIGGTYLVGSQGVNFSASWIADTYNIVFDWQGATGTPEADYPYQFDSGDMPLPAVGDRIKDGFEFAGWSETPGGSLVSGFRPTADDVLYAVWTDGSYNLSFDPKGGTVSQPSAAVPRGSDITLPTPAREGFVFTGWYDAPTGGNKVADGGDTISPSASGQLHGRWVQRSLFGVDLATLETSQLYNASNVSAIDTTLTHTPTGTSAAINIPSGALPSGTQVNVRFFKDTERQADLIAGDNNYIFSILLSWLYGSGDAATVPNTDPNKPIKVTLNNSSIKAGAAIYMVIGDQVTELGRATEDGTVTVELFEDPEIVVAATAPEAPMSVTAEAGDTTASVSWVAPATNGGAEITGYTVIANTGETCTWTAGPLTCEITGLTNDTPYTFTVVATNSVGDSVQSAPSTAVTPAETQYTVTFDSNGGSAIGAGSFTASSSIPEPQEPTRSGFKFLGWTITLDDENTLVTFPYQPSVAQNLVLFALWEALPRVETPPSSSDPAAGIEAVSGQARAWTKRISATQVKVYIKLPEMGVNYQIRLQKDGGEYERIMSKTVNTTDSDSLLIARGWYYLVRTIELPGDGRYRIEVTQDGQRMTLNGNDRPAVYSVIPNVL